LAVAVPLIMSGQVRYQARDLPRRMAFALRPVRLRSLGLVRLRAVLQGRRLVQRRFLGKERLQLTAFGKLLALALWPGRGQLQPTAFAPQLAQLPFLASEPSRRTAR
jgi:hypothetical protein